MQSVAMLWIRDGVLIDRMPVNAVAFAVTSLRHADDQFGSQTNLAALINFAFANSGISCGDKLRKLNSSGLLSIKEVSAAEEYYSRIAGEAASRCHYFEGICELLDRLNQTGVQNFITSAVEQSALDSWSHTLQGDQLLPHLREILGKRIDGFNKGKDHFEYVREQYGVDKIFYVADATTEIATGAKFAREFNITPIGFSHLITNEKIRQAHSLVMAAHLNQCSAPASDSGIDLALDENDLQLPDQKALTKLLKDAGAVHVVSGERATIVGELTNYLETCGVLAKKTV